MQPQREFLSRSARSFVNAQQGYRTVKRMRGKNGGLAPGAAFRPLPVSC
jgi:hypothetical protein